MRILITGSKGMLGQEFMRQLHMGTWEHGNMGTIEVMGWSRDDLDITSENEVMEKISAFKPGVVLNCAAYNNVDKAEDEPEVANAINGEAVGYLARAAAACDAAFVHFSTDYVFSGNLPTTKSDAAARNSVTGYTEEDMPDPVSAYGQSKAMGEQRMLSVFRHSEPRRVGRGEESLSHANQGVEISRALHSLEMTRRGQWYIVRTSKLFGPPGLGATSKKSFPEMMIGFARAKGSVEAIDGEVGSPTYVKDLAEATMQLVGLGLVPSRGGAQGPALQEPMLSGIYHIINSGSCTWYEYAKAAVESAGVVAEVIPVGPERFPRKAKRPENATLLNTKLPPLRSWQEALKEYLSGIPI